MIKHLATTAALVLALSAPGFGADTLSEAKGGKSPAVGNARHDFAFFDATNAQDPDAGVACGAELANGKPVPFIYHVAVSNFGSAATFLRITYDDGDLVRFAIPAGTSFSLTQAAGSTNGVDELITFTDESGNSLAGTVSVEVPAGAKPVDDLDSFCVTLEP